MESHSYLERALFSWADIHEEPASATKSRCEISYSRASPDEGFNRLGFRPGSLEDQPVYTMLEGAGHPNLEKVKAKVYEAVKATLVIAGISLEFICYLC